MCNIAKMVGMPRLYFIGYMMINKALKRDVKGFVILTNA
jgi:hypothetical protein